MDIQPFVDGVVDGSLTDAQVEAWLREVYDNGLSEEETVELTHAMLHSGMTLKWPEKWADLVVDKHSPGGVGDKGSISLAPALAACGVKVPMIFSLELVKRTPSVSRRSEVITTSYCSTSSVLKA